MGKQAQKAIRLTLSTNGGVASLDVSGPRGMASVDVDANLALGLMEELGLLELAEEVGGADSWDLTIVAKPPGDEAREHADGHRMLNIREVAKRSSLSVATINRMERDDEEFPRPVYLSPGRIAWREDDNECWLRTRREKPPSQYRRVRRPEPL